MNHGNSVGVGDGEMTQPFTALAALQEGQDSHAHIRWLTIVCNSCSRGSDALFWPLQGLESCPSADSSLGFISSLGLFALQ